MKRLASAIAAEVAPRTTQEHFAALPRNTDALFADTITHAEFSRRNSAACAAIERDGLADYVRAIWRTWHRTEALPARG